MRELFYRISDNATLNNWLFALTVIIIALLAAFITNFLIMRILPKIFGKMVSKTKTVWDDIIFNTHFFHRISWVLMPIVIKYILIAFYLEINTGILNFMFKYILSTWIIIALVLLIFNFFDSLNKIYERYPISKNRPIGVFFQVIKIILVCTAIIIIISMYIGKSPDKLLVGMSAFAAVILLIFKDSILGFVAGIQLISNNMVQIGDWITMEKYDADGNVLEINLTTVKIQNFDMTITTIPTYKLVSESFTNWKGMIDTKGRRVMRHIYIDLETIHYLSIEEIGELSKSEILKDYLNIKVSKITESNKLKQIEIDKRHLTNIGVFREYLVAWLKSQDTINGNRLCMVRQKQPGATGLPLEIYCFTYTTNWVEYEGIQSDIFDHIFAIIELFGLKCFEYKSFAVVDNVN